MSIFVDTSALYALVDQSDANHHAARLAFSRLRNTDQVLLTHNYALVETVALVQRRLGLDAVRDLRDSLFPLLLIEWIDAKVHDLCLAVTTSGQKSISFVDRVSFEVARRHGCGSALAYDEDFPANGIPFFR